MADFVSHPPPLHLRAALIVSKPASIKAFATFYQIDTPPENGNPGFRHHDEWARMNLTPKEKARQMRSQAILAAVLRKPEHSIRRNVCPDVIKALTGGSYEQLNRNFFDFAKALAKCR